MAELTYRRAIATAIAQEMRRDDRVVLPGDNVGRAGSAFKATEGLFDAFGPERVQDTPISEPAIVGAAMGAAMTGLRPIADMTSADFLATCWDMVAVELAKMRYMKDGQVTVPLVVTAYRRGGLGYGGTHSQSLENWAMAVPGLKVVAPSTPADAFGMMAASIRDEDPVVFFAHKFFAHKTLLSAVGKVPDGEHVEPLGRAITRRSGSDVTIVSLGAMVPRALEAAELLETRGISAAVLDLRCLVPLDVTALFEAVSRTGKVCIVEENPRLRGWGAEVSALLAEELFHRLDGPIVRVTTPHIPLPAAPTLESAAIPSVKRICEAVQKPTR